MEVQVQPLGHIQATNCTLWHRIIPSQAAQPVLMILPQYDNARLLTTLRVLARPIKQGCVYSELFGQNMITDNAPYFHPLHTYSNNITILAMTFNT